METQTLDIEAFWPSYFEDCPQCIERLKDGLGSLDGMQSVTVDAAHRDVRVSYDKDLLTYEAISKFARDLGVTLANRFNHESIRLAGLDCPDCALKLETAVRKMRGVAWASLNYATSVLIVEYEPQATSLPAIQRRVSELGYGVVRKEPAAAAPGKVLSMHNLRLALTVLSGILLGAGGLVKLAAGTASAPNVLFALSAVAGGVFAARAAFYSVKGMALDTNFLMTAAALGAFGLGEFGEAAAVMFLFSLGSTLEALTVEKTRRSIGSLVEAFPSHASVRRDGQIVEVALGEIEIGEVVLVKPGGHMPVDGTIVSGDSAINEAPITGESAPRSKSTGDMVYAGSINGLGAIEVRTASTAEDNTLARIVHLVEEAQSQKAPSQRFSEAFGRYYTPVVIGLAVMAALFGPMLFGGSLADWLRRALTLLVVSCPCALVISTPVAIVAAIGNAAKSGVLIKGGAHLETLGKVSVVAFDKTGTLTTGRPSLCGIVPFGTHSIEDVLSTGAAIESRSEHPLAEAMVDKSRDMGIPEQQVSFFEALPGRGARAVLDGGAFYIGSKRLMEELGFDVPGESAVAELTDRGCTVVYLSDETALWGAIGASDTIKPNARKAIEGLRRVGIRKTVMLTGDTAQAGEAVARELGIDEHHTELLPQDKLALIHQLAESHTVAMVGDGINDAPALAAADVGIAMGGAGSQAAVEAADVALMADDITMLPYAIQLSRRTRAIIIQNTVFALAVVLALVGGALMQWVTLATGVLGHEGSALLVIANSMRLLKRSRATLTSG